MTLSEFYFSARYAHSRNKSWRYGQVLFNTLKDLRPDLAEQVRGTDLDPYHKDLEGLDKFRAWLTCNWRNDG